MSVKPATKTLWLLILAAFLIGAGLAGIGFAFGGFLPNGIQYDGLRFYNWRTGEELDARLNVIEYQKPGTFDGEIYEVDAFDNLRVTTANTSIDIVRGESDRFAYALIVDEPETFEVKSEGGTLSIEQEPIHFGMRGTRLMMDALNGFPQGGVVRVYVPESWQFNELALESASGDIVVGGEGMVSNSPLMGKELKINSVSGATQLRDSIRCADATIESVSGGIEIFSLYTSGDITIEMVSGWLSAAELGEQGNPANAVNLHVISGTITVENISAREINVNTVSGDVDLSVADLASYSKQVESVSGNVNFDGMRMKGGASFDAGGGAKEISVTTISGNVRINTAEVGPDEAPELLETPELP